MQNVFVHFCTRFAGPYYDETIQKGLDDTSTVHVVQCRTRLPYGNRYLITATSAENPGPGVAKIFNDISSE